MYTPKLDLPEKKIEHIRTLVKCLLFAERDRLFNMNKLDLCRFEVHSGYYGEAFGVLRTLEVLGYGYLGSSNCEDDGQNLRYWFCQMCDEVMTEEMGSELSVRQLMQKYSKKLAEEYNEPRPR